MSFFQKLKQGLSKTKDTISGRIDDVIKSFRKVDEDLFEELEEVLIAADVGVNTSMEIMDRLRDAVKSKKIDNPEQVKQELIDIIVAMMDDNSQQFSIDTKPTVVMVIGVNGAGKTTTIGKMELPDAKCEVLLVLDATTGQNALSQAKLFADTAEITGIVLTKIDGTAKGGVTIAIKAEQNIPVKFIGVGEGIDDLSYFDSREFVKALFDSEEA